MRLTIGMATYDDFDGAYFTIQALRLYHQEVMDRVEIVVIDNNPNSSSSKYLENFVVNWAHGKYIPFNEVTGTTVPRNKVFEYAETEAVMCVDSHVMIWPGAIKKLLDYYESNPDTKNLYSGPLVYDDLTTYSTHFNNVWRSEMLGIWGTAWKCDENCDFIFTTIPSTDNIESIVTLDMRHKPLDKCPKCGKNYPGLLDARKLHNTLTSIGCRVYGEINDNPFSIPGMGLGLFTALKKNWLGFNPHFRGFGGEEMYIHEKYRMNGGDCICLPFLRWVHRFARPAGVPYVKHLTVWNKVRNYVIGRQELGLQVDDIYAHFKERMPKHEWDYLLEDPVGHTFLPSHVIANTVQNPGRPQPRASADYNEIVAWTCTIERDLDKHVPKLQELAKQCDYVIEFTKRRESTVPLLSCNKKLISYQYESDPLLNRLKSMLGDKYVWIKISDPAYIPPENDLLEVLKLTEGKNFDMLFLDSVGEYDIVMKTMELLRPYINKWIVLHDTAYYTERGERGGRGLLPVVRDWNRKYPEWFVKYHTQEEYGLTVLSRLDSEKKKLPSIFDMGKNFLSSMAKAVLEGPGMVTNEQYEERLNICALCENRNDQRCGVCGCFISGKAKLKASECPLGKWPDVKGD